MRRAGTTRAQSPKPSQSPIDFAKNQLRRQILAQKGITYMDENESPELDYEDEMSKQKSPSQRKIKFQTSPVQKRRSPSKTPSKHIESLHSNEGYSSRKKAIKRELDATFAQMCTFQPATNSLPSDRIFNYANTEANMSKAERFDRLVQPKTAPDPEVKRKQREAEEIAECSFKPTISSYAQKKARGRKPIDEKLHDEARKRSKSREVMYKTREDAEMEHCTFTPDTRGSLSLKPPIYKRMDEIQEQHQRALRHATDDARDGELKFAPQISAKSSQLASKRSKSPNTRTKQATEEKICEEQNSKYPFTPQISERELPDDVQGMNFVERQKFYEQRHAERMQRIQKKFHNTEVYTFQPDIDMRSKDISKSSTDPFERLADDRGRQARREQLTQEQHSKFTYSPRINIKSRTMGRSVSFSEKVSIAGTPREAKTARGEIEEQFSYKPEIQIRSRNKSSEYNRNTDISENIKQRRKEFYDNIKLKRESLSAKDLHECTFTPKTNKRTSTQQGTTVMVRGLDKFLHDRDRAADLRREQARRENQVFGYAQKYKPRAYTIPQPFPIHPSNKMDKSQELKQKLEEEYKNTYTFKPSTLESRNRTKLTKMFK